MSERSGKAPLEFLFVMDPLNTIQRNGDTTFDLMHTAEARGHLVYACEPRHLSLRDGRVVADVARVSMFREGPETFVERSAETRDLAQFSSVWMRKDPPVDAAFYQTTLLLLHAELAGAKVVNRPSSILLANEKLYALRFPRWIPETLVTSSLAEVQCFAAAHPSIILKPIDGNGGRGIFKSHAHDSNLGPIWETLSNNGRQAIIAQRFLDEVSAGDKRIILVNGEPVGAINRVAKSGEHRSNMHVGGTPLGTTLSAKEQAICAELGPVLRQDGLFFVGIDVIGGFLTEVNVTSPTGVQEIRRLSGIDVSEHVLKLLE